MGLVIQWILYLLFLVLVEIIRTSLILTFGCQFVSGDGVCGALEGAEASSSPSTSLSLQWCSQVSLPAGPSATSLSQLPPPRLGL